MKLTSRRDIALDVVHKWYKEDCYVNLQLSKSLRGIDSRNASFVTNIVYGVLRNLCAVDYEIDCFLQKKIKPRDDCLRSVLRCAFFELSFTESAPYAVVNEYVSLAGDRGNEGWRRLVNGILRARIRKGRPQYPTFKDAFAGALFDYSMPREIGELLRADLGEADAVRTIEAFSRPAPLSLRVDGDRDAFCRKLEEDNIRYGLSSLSPYGVILPEGGSIAALLEKYPREITVQGQCSQLVAHVMQPVPGWDVLDMCAAPGGKTTHIARLMQGRGNVFAADVHEHKLEIIKKNRNRMGLDNINLCLKDGTLWGEEKPESFDGVLADVPCSGLGVLAARPESRYRKDPSDIMDLAELQRRLFASAYKTLKPGGVLIYSTCTLTNAENIDNFGCFLETFPGLEPVSFDALLPGLIEEDKKTAAKGWVRLLPNNYGGEGFFIAKFRKNY